MPEWLRKPAGPVQLKPDQQKISAYFNVDNGSGRIRGIYLEQNAGVAPIFKQWIAPLKDLGVTTITLRHTGGTDHENFDAVGIPGFQFIQDPLDYGSRTHHTNMDTYERLQPADLAQAATVEAIFVYNAAMRDQMLPRKPLPHPEREEQSTSPLKNVMPGVEAKKRASRLRPSRKSRSNRRRNNSQRRRIRNRRRRRRIRSEAWIGGMQVSPLQGLTWGTRTVLEGIEVLRLHSVVRHSGRPNSAQEDTRRPAHHGFKMRGR